MISLLLLGVLFSSELYAAAKCKQGFVWREAYKGDYVCVVPQSREQARKDNMEAKSRIEKGEKCKQGYVWREAIRKDRVCVTPEIRKQTAYENKMHSSRVEAAAAKVTKKVDCPVRSVDVNITSSIPQPWWQTPQRGNLAGTDIMRIGGKPTLVCKYRAYGGTVSIMSNLPDGTTSCNKTRDGFVCN